MGSWVRFPAAYNYRYKLTRLKIAGPEVRNHDPKLRLGKLGLPVHELGDLGNLLIFNYNRLKFIIIELLI